MPQNKWRTGQVIAGQKSDGETRNVNVDDDGNLVIGGVVEGNLDAANDEVTVYGSDDGGTTRRVIKTDAAGELQVDIVNSVTADTELPAATALADGTANPTAPAVGAHLMGWNGTTWDRLDIDSNDNLNVNLNTRLDATNDAVRLGDGTDLANVTAAGELNVLASAQPGVDIGDVTINNAAGASAVNVQDGGNSLTVDAVDLDIRNLANAQDNVGVYGTDGTTARQLKTDAAGELQVDVVGSLPAGTNNIGDVDIASAIPAGNNNIGDVDVATLQGTADSGNSSTANLTAGAAFTGTAFDTLNYSSAVITIKPSHASATNGLSFQWSPDGTNWDVTSTSTVDAGQGRGFAITHRGRYFRIVYTNGGTTTTSFRLNTIHRPSIPGVISRPLKDALDDDNFAHLVKATLWGKKPDTSYVAIDATTGGNLKASIEEFGTTGTWANGTQVTVATTATSLLAANTNRKAFTINHHSGTVDVFVGLTGLTATSYVWRLQPGEVLFIEKASGAMPTAQIFGIIASGTATVVVSEVT